MGGSNGKIQGRFCMGMLEPKAGGTEKKAFAPEDQARLAIRFIAQYGVSCMGEVYTQLVLAPGLGIQPDMGETSPAQSWDCLEALKEGKGRFARNGGIPRAISWDVSQDEGFIGFLDRTPFKLAAQVNRRMACFGNKQ